MSIPAPIHPRLLCVMSALQFDWSIWSRTRVGWARRGVDAERRAIVFAMLRLPFADGSRLSYPDIAQMTGLASHANPHFAIKSLSEKAAKHGG